MQAATGFLTELQRDWLAIIGLVLSAVQMRLALMSIGRRRIQRGPVSGVSNGQDNPATESPRDLAMEQFLLSTGRGLLVVASVLLGLSLWVSKFTVPNDMPNSPLVARIVMALCAVGFLCATGFGIFMLWDRGCRIHSKRQGFVAFVALASWALITMAAVAANWWGVRNPTSPLANAAALLGITIIGGSVFGVGGVMLQILMNWAERHTQG